MRIGAPVVLVSVLASVSAFAETKPEPQKPASTEAAAPAADASKEGDWKAGFVSFGVQQKDVDTISSKFLEYRDVPNGLVAPGFRFQGKSGTFRYDVVGENIRQDDQRLRARLGGGDTWKFEGDYNRIPHRFGNGGRTLLEQTSEGVFQMSDTLQRTFQTTLEATTPRSLINFPFLLNLVSPSLASANLVDVRLTRERGQAAFVLKPTTAFEVKVSYGRERRTGSRAASGTSFGFGNVVELPEPLHYLTQDFAVDGQYEASWGVLQAGFRYNTFANRIESLTFDNPFRITDSTDPSSYQAPGSASVNGPVVGRMSLPPDNEAVFTTASALFKMARNTRLSADASIGTWRQNKSPFLPYATNTAITTPLNASSVASLPATKLDGKAQVTALSAYLTSQPWTNVSLSARARLYDFDNQTPRLTFPGYVRFDGPWSAIPRISVPYGYRNDRFDLTAGYRFDRVSLEAGLKRVKMERTFRETEDTVEDGFSLSASVHGSDWFMARASYERAAREFEGLEIEKSEDSSFVTPGAPTNMFAILPTTPQTNGQPLCAAGTVCNLRFDQANKDIERLNTMVTLSLGDKTTVSGTYQRSRDDYKDSRLGLLSADIDTFSVDLDFTPGERATLYAFATREKIADFQVGRQSGATPSGNPLDDWTSSVDDRVDTAGVGGEFVLVPEKWFLSLTGRYQKSNGNNTLFSAPGGAPALARTGISGIQSLAVYDDTKVVTLAAEGRYHLAADWSVSLGAWYEDYRFNDLASDGLTNYVPASFFLAANDGSYKAKVAYVRFTRTF